MPELETPKEISPGQKEQPPQGSRLSRIGIGGLLGAFVGFFLVQGIPGAAFGVVLGWYLVRGLWGAIAGGLFGWFFITGMSGAVAGFVAGAMIGGNFVGRKGKWIIFATVLAVVAVSLLSNHEFRKYLGF